MAAKPAMQTQSRDDDGKFAADPVAGQSGEKKAGGRKSRPDQRYGADRAEIGVQIADH